MDPAEQINRKKQVRAILKISFVLLQVEHMTYGELQLTEVVSSGNYVRYLSEASKTGEAAKHP
jgi:hypothetical protein